MNSISFNGMARMDWGFGNPNKTAALIAILMIAVWILPYSRKWGFWPALVAFTALGLDLIYTFSRGGILAVLTAGIPLLIWAPHPWPRPRQIGIFVSLLLLLGAVIWVKAPARYFQGIIHDDLSISNRLEIWKSVPAMIANAPEGWGVGNSGNAYIQWYQPLNRSERYRTLVNSHFTWLVEFGWPFRVLYLIGWSAIFVICWPSKSARWRSVAFAVWVCFFVAAFFSSVAEVAILWIVPLLFLCAAIFCRFAKRESPTMLQWAIASCIPTSILAALWLLGQNSPHLNGTASSVIFGHGAPEVVVFYDPRTMGDLYGKAIREAGVPTEVIVSPGTHRPPVLKGKTLVLGSDKPSIDPVALKAAIKECRYLILFDPSFFPEEIGSASSLAGKTMAYFGEFSQSPSVEAWRSSPGYRQLPGIGDFFPRWADLIEGTGALQNPNGLGR